ncbi:hypothetical protein [Alkalihalobacterium bogoriense]|uniref:hypothetical protein n=1 Tax=Alkalihalobacterium bogoriense TaxID=246272 RepID=UPI00047CBBDC|nr:hypothetical protein [Alkalihalobacterium bogoriense]
MLKKGIVILLCSVVIMTACSKQTSSLEEKKEDKDPRLSYYTEEQIELIEEIEEAVATGETKLLTKEERDSLDRTIRLREGASYYSILGYVDMTIHSLDEIDAPIENKEEQTFFLLDFELTPYFTKHHITTSDKYSLANVFHVEVVHDEEKLNSTLIDGGKLEEIVGDHKEETTLQLLHLTDKVEFGKPIIGSLLIATEHSEEITFIIGKQGGLTSKVTVSLDHES